MALTPAINPLFRRVVELQRGAGNRATAALLQRRVFQVPSPPHPQPWYSDVTRKHYMNEFAALWDEAMVPSKTPDPPWTPQGVFDARMKAAPKRALPDRTPFEQLIAAWEGSTQRIKTAAGWIKLSRGWGQQPYITSRLGDYNEAAVAVNYDDISRVLDDRDLEAREELAWQILQAALGTGGRFHDYDDRTQRAAAHLLGITQLAEEHARRTPGAAEFARAGLQAVADGTHSFTQVFSRKSGLYIPAPVHGTQNMRDAAAGNLRVDEHLAGLMDMEVEKT